MDRRTIAIDTGATRLRRVGRLARRRMRIDGPDLADGVHGDGTLTVVITGLGSRVAGVPDSFEWRADRPIALVIIRSGKHGEDVAFQVGPSRFGTARGTSDGAAIRSVAFCYDAAPGEVATAASNRSEGPNGPEGPEGRLVVPGAAAIGGEDRAPERRRIAAAASIPTRRERRSILAQLLRRAAVGRATT